jgi:hypothetical protein
MLRNNFRHTCNNCYDNNRYKYNSCDTNARSTASFTCCSACKAFFNTIRTVNSNNKWKTTNNRYTKNNRLASERHTYTHNNRYTNNNRFASKRHIHTYTQNNRYTILRAVLGVTDTHTRTVTVTRYCAQCLD